MPVQGSAFIEDSQLWRKSAKMSSAKAYRIAARLEAISPTIAEVRVRQTQGGAYVEYRPTDETIIAKLFEDLMGPRRERSVELQRKYRWQRNSDGTWRCRGPQPNQDYRINLRKPHCNCSDWHRISSVGGVCKHYLCAEEAERRFQAHKAKAQEGI